MNLGLMIIKEMIHRKMNFLLSLLAIITAVGFCVAFFTTGEASKRETKRNMRDIGQNLRIIAKETPMNEFWDTGYSDILMPESWIYEFEKVKGVNYSHLTATLQRKIQWKGAPAFLHGISSEVAPPDRKKPSMVFNIEPGTVYLGYTLAVVHGIKKRDEIEIQGNRFKVAQCLSEQGSIEDIQIYAHLKDVQKILNLEGQINEIQALDCYCQHPSKDSLTVIREQLEPILPGAKVVKMQAIALAREKQRTLVEKYFALIMPLVVVVCGIWIGSLAAVNTRERKHEIGVMRALGYGTGAIVRLILGKAVFIGFVGAMVGFAMGTVLALTVGPDIFQVTAKLIKPMYGLLGWSLLAAPALACLSSFIPAMSATVLDPAEILRHE
jgi:ABC-type lipoprotein release transport system permease subunit